MGTSIKEEFRRKYGTDYTRKCGDCKHFLRVEKGRGYVFKCEEMGITASTATDIRKSGPACLLFDRNGAPKVTKEVNEKYAQMTIEDSEFEIVRIVDLTDDTIERIADAVVRKMRGGGKHA